MQNSMLLRNDEVRFLQRTRNHRLVMFLGMGLTESGDTFIVLEYMDGGSLDTKLWGTRDTLLLGREAQNSSDVTEGLTYLHYVHSSVRTLSAKRRHSIISLFSTRTFYSITLTLNLTAIHTQIRSNTGTSRRRIRIFYSKTKEQRSELNHKVSSETC